MEENEIIEFYGHREYRAYGSASACNQQSLQMKRDFEDYDDCRNGNVRVTMVPGISGEIIVAIEPDAFDYPDYLITFDEFMRWMND